ncbi:MAG: glycosyltransferase [Flammeovirgaceae bacterium]|nr:glycosyltransferase [Flammeovirgaceae bacterium]
MNSSFRYSVVVPVYNRPDEVAELLDSLTKQTYANFEVILVEDGSTERCDKVYEKFADLLSIQYYFKPNSGPGPSRNYGFTKARGEYVVVFDSDCLIPTHYFEAVENFISKAPVDAWGGPDRGHENFTPLQQAMGYTMSSFLTTGGIRGGKKRTGRFQPRSFNMGMSRKVVEQTGGFNFNRLAEDIELSVRIKKAGFDVHLIPDAFVYHKRRSTWKQFFWQVYSFGRGRIHVGQVHPGEIKITHWLPLLFILGLIASLLIWVVSWQAGLLGISLYAVYFMAILNDSYKTTKSMWVSILSVPSAFIQLTGYGLGFGKEWLKVSLGR